MTREVGVDPSTSASPRAHDAMSAPSEGKDHTIVPARCGGPGRHLASGAPTRLFSKADPARILAPQQSRTCFIEPCELVQKDASNGIVRLYL